MTGPGGAPHAPPPAMAAVSAVAEQPPAGPALEPFDLARCRWRKRVLVLFAPAAGDSLLAEEEAALRGRAAGATERDLVVVRAPESGGGSADGRPLGAGEAAALRRRLGAEAGRFTAVLVGKDGRVALRSRTPVVAGRLFPLIDAMPMRRDEVRRDGGRRPSG